jgi:N-acetylglucosamine kinase-like BadF-type ATPase
MLGDEGSGAYIGKKLLTDFLHQEMPLYLAVDFNETFKIDYHQVLDKIYKQDFPNRYLASFTTFAGKHKGEQYIVELLENAFDAFIKYQLETLDFDKTKTDIGFIGSVAFHFKEILINRLEINNYKCSKILSDPMDDLFDYHIDK